MRPVLLALALSLGLPHTASAERALYIVNAGYDDLSDLRQMRQVVRTARGWSDELGFAVTEGRNLDFDGMLEALATLDGAPSTEPLVIVLGGHFVSGSGGVWLLGSEAGDVTLANLPGDALSVDVVMAIAALAPGRALVVLAQDADARLSTGAGLVPGLEALEVPQGVTVLTGPPDAIADALSGPLLEPGTVIRTLARDDAELEASGFLPSDLPVLSAAAEVESVVAAPPLFTNEAEEDGDDDELEFWLAVRELDTAAAYRTYLSRYPGGRFVATAEERLAGLSETPEERAERIEDELGLTRAQRQEIQRDLAILDYDTRGIDGIFGAGTRGAIAEWQAETGFPATSYLTAEQIARLDSQAAIRAAELEEQARQERLAEEQRDRAYWQATGRGEDEAGLRAYLEEFPEGLFAEVARARLDEIEADRRAEAEAQQRDYWDDIRSEDTIEAYEEYLDRFPDGPFAGAAQARIDQLRRDTDVIARARAEEQALNLPGFTRVLVERTLLDLGYVPGNVDGRFDENTRRAIRQYQNSRQLPVTGYLTQDTVVRLLAGGIGAIVQ